MARVPITNSTEKQSRGLSLFRPEDDMLWTLMLDEDPRRPDRSNTTGRILRGVYELRLLNGTLRPHIKYEVPESEYRGAALEAGLIDPVAYEQLAANFYRP